MNLFHRILFRLVKPKESHWMTRLTRAQLAHWEAKPQSDKDWWYANTTPDDRKEILQTEIESEASYEEFRKLPQATQDAFIKYWDDEADAARARIKQRLAKQSSDGQWVPPPEIGSP